MNSDRMNQLKVVSKHPFGLMCLPALIAQFDLHQKYTDTKTEKKTTKR